MAAAFFTELADKTRAVARSAGTDPAEAVDQTVIEAMQEVGIAVGSSRPRKLTDDDARWATLLITMGCGDQCPFVPGLERDEWPLTDPNGLPLLKVRQIRDEIQRRVSALVISRGW